MPREQMNEQQVAAYLHMDLREVTKLASRGRVPCRKIGGKYVFTKVEVDHWVFEQMGTLDSDRLARIEHGVSRHHGYDAGGLTISRLIPDAGVAAPLLARTREAAIRGLVDLADRAGLVHVRGDLLAEIRKREELCSTSLLPGVAMPHPRHPLPYDIAESFVVVGLTTSGIPYGAENGSLTRLFFLICCKDDQTHLHVLARLARLLQEPAAVSRFLEAQDGEELLGLIRQCERGMIG